MSPLYKKVFWVTLFSIAMGYLETTVVIYLRLLYYPEGFEFPITPLETDIALFELMREAATIIMLIVIGVLSGKNLAQRFAFFIYSFAIWDIFYYVFLYITLGWPESLFTWDLLFLIPVLWVGPVISPIIISCLMILLAFQLIRFNSYDLQIPVSLKEWILLIAGSVIVIISWTKDYVSFIANHNPNSSIWSTSEEELFTLTMQYIPKHFDWALFFIGTAVILASIFHYSMKAKKSLAINL